MAQKTILLVDDEVIVVTVITRLLEMQGHIVIPTTRASLAISTFAQMHDIIDIAFIDWHIPDMDGVALARAMREIRDNIFIGLITGAAIAELPAETYQYVNQVFLKPIDSVQLMQIVNYG